MDLVNYTGMIALGPFDVTDAFWACNKFSLYKSWYVASTMVLATYHDLYNENLFHG